MNLLIFLVNAGCAGLNGYFFYKACKNPDVYPLPYRILVGILTAYCFVVAASVV